MISRRVRIWLLSLVIIASQSYGEETTDSDSGKESSADVGTEKKGPPGEKERSSDVGDEKKGSSGSKEKKSDVGDEDKGDDDKDKKDTKEKKDAAPPRIGNFSLPTSQQPAALYGFGGNIIDQGEVQPYFFADEFVGKKKLVIDLIPSLLFGITDNLSIFFNFPFTPQLRDDGHRSSGLEDFFIQLEFAFYTKKTWLYEDQCTVVGNVTFPTGSVKKNPPTGFGSPSIFIGATYYRMMVDWFLFTAPGAVLTTSEHGTKIGDQFLYQFGFGRTFLSSPRGCIYAWMLEVDGQYSKKNRIKGCIDPNSGGNFVLVTPSIWISSKYFTFQFGISLPVEQNLFGDQHKIDYGFNLNISASFYPDEM